VVGKAYPAAAGAGDVPLLVWQTPRRGYDLEISGQQVVDSIVRGR
jgi:hypothetical protein